MHLPYIRLYIPIVNNETIWKIWNSELNWRQIFHDKFIRLSWYNLEISERVDEQSVTVSLKWSTFATHFVIIQTDGRSWQAIH